MIQLILITVNYTVVIIEDTKHETAVKMDVYPRMTFPWETIHFGLKPNEFMHQLPRALSPWQLINMVGALAQFAKPIPLA